MTESSSESEAVMKLVILLAATFCCTIYSTSGSESTCLTETYDKPCGKKCEPDFEEPCCQISRCIKCYTDIGLDKCGSIAELGLQVIIQAMNQKWAANGCTESKKYPSTKCLYYFYTVWFYVIPLLILAVIGGVVAFVIIRRRRRF